MHSVNLEAIVKSEYPAVIRMVAQKLQQTPYMRVGSFLSSLNKSDLVELVSMCNAVIAKGDYGDALDCICLLGEMIAQAEGTPLDKPDVNRASSMMILLTFEDLARKGIIEFYRENATLGADLDQLNIAKLKD